MEKYVSLNGGVCKNDFTQVWQKQDLIVPVLFTIYRCGRRDRCAIILVRLNFSEDLHEFDCLARVMFDILGDSDLLKFSQL